MKNPIVCKQEIFGYSITATAFQTGNDWNVTVAGGCAPHVGSVSLAEYQNGDVTCRSLLRENHKDQIVGERFAVKISELTRRTVCVCCGIHFDHPAPEDLEKIVCVADQLLEDLLTRMM